MRGSLIVVLLSICVFGVVDEVSFGGHYRDVIWYEIRHQSIELSRVVQKKMDWLG